MKRKKGNLGPFKTNPTPLQRFATAHAYGLETIRQRFFFAGPPEPGTRVRRKGKNKRLPKDPRA